MEISIAGWRSFVESAAEAAGVEIFFCEGARALTVFRKRPNAPLSEIGGFSLEKTVGAGPYVSFVDRLVFDGREWTLFLGPLDKNGGRSGESAKSLAEAKTLLAKLLGDWPEPP